MTDDETAGERSVVPPSETFAAIPVVAPRRAHPLRRAALIGGSVLVHLAVLQLILWTQPPASPLAEPTAVTVALLQPLPKPPPVKPPPQPTPLKDTKAPAPAKGPPKESPTPAKAAAPSHVRPTPAPPMPTPLPPAARTPPPKEAFTELSAGDAAGAQGAGDAEGGGSGGGGGPGGGGNGGGCNMVRRLQDALSRDSRVKAAVGGALGERMSTGRGMVVWNGDWVASHGEDGKGLATLRQAIAWEVGFAPKACREQAVRGYVLVKLTDNTRIALGAPNWRWSDLLGLRR